MGKPTRVQTAMQEIEAVLEKCNKELDETKLRRYASFIHRCIVDLRKAEREIERLRDSISHICSAGEKIKKELQADFDRILEQKSEKK